MKSRILRALVVVLLTICIVFAVSENTADIGEVSAENMTEEVIVVKGCRHSEAEKKQIYKEYLEKLYAEDITSLRGVLGCKVNFDLGSDEDDESEIIVQYFYDPTLVADAVELEEIIRNFVSTNSPDAEGVYVRGTPVTYRNAVEYKAVDDQVFFFFSADLNLKWNYVPVVPN